MPETPQLFPDCSANHEDEAERGVRGLLLQRGWPTTSSGRRTVLPGIAESQS